MFPLQKISKRRNIKLSTKRKEEERVEWVSRNVGISSVLEKMVLIMIPVQHDVTLLLSINVIICISIQKHFVIM